MKWYEDLSSYNTVTSGVYEENEGYKHARTLTWFDNTVEETFCSCLEVRIVSEEDTRLDGPTKNEYQPLAIIIVD